MSARHVPPGSHPEVRVEVTATAYGSPEARALTQQVQDYYVQLYGGTDDAPLEETELTPPAGAFLLGWVADTAVAMGGWRQVEGVDALGGRRPAELRRMFVVPTERRHGVARVLLAELERTATAAGADVMVLSTGGPQRDALAFYASCGYVDVPSFGFYAEAAGIRCLGKRLDDGRSDPDRSR